MNKPNLTFAESYCAQHGIPREKFARTVFKRVLYRRTLLFIWILQFFKQDYFVADFDLIYGVERLRRMRDFNSEAERFNEHPSNRGWLRRRLRLRVSTYRLKLLIKETLPLSTMQKGKFEGTSAPFDSASESKTDENLSLARS